MKILITGTSGFLGKTLGRHLTTSAHTVTALPGRLDLDQFLETPHGTFDCVIHTAFAVDFSEGHVPPEQASSVLRTKKLIEALPCLGNPAFIFLSAAGVYGVSSSPQARDETYKAQTDPMFEGYMKTAYIQQKLACEPLLDGLTSSWTCLYLTTVYGSGMPPFVVQNLKNLKSLMPVTPAPPGGTSYLLLEDFLNAIDACLEKQPQGRFLVSSGNTTYASLLQTAIRAQGIQWRKKVFTIPSWTRVLLLKVFQRLGRASSAAVLLSSFGYKYYSSLRLQRMTRWFPQASLEPALSRVMSDL